MDTNFTYTLADLREAKFPGTPLAVIGHPIQHSVSPAMHNAAIAKMRRSDSRFSDWAYYRFDIAPEDFAEAIPLFYKRNFLGLNLTIPHKVQAGPDLWCLARCRAYGSGQYPRLGRTWL
jgi:shikimate dehydrogenase